ncbi:hypothetical protein [Salinibacter grassmerensis]|uniref:hypothetical protein n=1 Tax=Salinibacter grassmerensis TaxID=3040353 RepID=UPI0021E86300|nr:hypothetical protein [Salinibacter grassmerensis]
MIKKVPRRVIEGGSDGIILIAIYLVAIREYIQQAVPMIDCTHYIEDRLIPALQQAVHGLASAHFNVSALDKLHRELQD